MSHKILEFLGHKIFVKIYNLINFECFLIKFYVSETLIHTSHNQIDFWRAKSNRNEPENVNQHPIMLKTAIVH